jgi:hypothetical protein
MSDCYQSAEVLQAEPGARFSWGQPVLDFQGVSDENGLAVLPNLPTDVTELGGEHPQYGLPAVGTSGGEKRRQASLSLIAGQTNRVSVQLELKNESPIRHY